MSFVEVSYVEACAACVRGEHDGCWEDDPPQGLEYLDCPCEHPRVRFVVRPSWLSPGGWGWSVWDRMDRRFTGGWFGAHVKMAAQQMADLENQKETSDDVDSAVQG